LKQVLALLCRTAAIDRELQGEKICQFRERTSMYIANKVYSDKATIWCQKLKQISWKNENAER